MFLIVSCYVFFITLLFIIFYNPYCNTFIIIFLMFGREIILSAISPVVSFLPEMVSCYFKTLEFLVILIFVFNHYRLHSRWLLPLNHTAAKTHNCLSILLPLGGVENNNIYFAAKFLFVRKLLGINAHRDVSLVSGFPVVSSIEYFN